MRVNKFECRITKIPIVWNTRKCTLKKTHESQSESLPLPKFLADHSSLALIASVLCVLLHKSTAQTWRCSYRQWWPVRTLRTVATVASYLPQLSSSNGLCHPLAPSHHHLPLGIGFSLFFSNYCLFVLLFSCPGLPFHGHSSNKFIWSFSPYVAGWRIEISDHCYFCWALIF